MKTVVVEIREDYAAVLSEDGVVRRIRNRNYSVGEELDLTQAQLKEDTVAKSLKGITKRTSRMIAAAAAAFVVVAGGFGYYDVNYVAAAYVTIDVNPSLEFALNARDQVISVTALNDEATEIADTLTQEKIRGMSIDAAMSKAEELLSEQDYLGEDEDYILVSVASNSEKRKERISGAVEEHSRKESSPDRVEVVTTSMKERKHAKKMNISTGRYEMAKEISGDGSDESAMKELGNRPVKELMEMRDAPTEKPAEKTDEKPESRPEEKPDEKPSEKPAEKP